MTELEVLELIQQQSDKMEELMTVLVFMTVALLVTNILRFFFRESEIK